MFKFLKKKSNVDVSKPKDDFLSNENAAYNTKGDSSNIFVDNVDYNSLTYQEPVYNVPEYKASNLSDLGIVVDSTDLGFNKDLINPNLKIIDIPQSEEEIIDKYEEPVELIDIIETTENNRVDEVPDIEKKSNDINNSIYKIEKEEPIISIFGSNDGITNKKSYTSLEQPHEEKPELIEDVEYTSDGYKICPKCGTILKSDAPVCFMCSKSFIKKNNNSRKLQ